MLLEFLALLSIALILLYKWSTANYSYFKDRGIEYDNPFPLFGSLKNVVLRKRSMFDTIVDLYKKSDKKIFGIFESKTPILMIRDPEIIKQVTVKDFDHFVNHRTMFTDADEGGVFANNLFFMTDQKWKDMRTTLSPAFTGSKMRLMFQLIREVSVQAVHHLKKEGSLKNGVDIDMKAYFTRFTNDVIATTAFGIKVDSLNDKDNEFYQMGKKITSFTAWQNIKFFIFSSFKGLAKVLKLELFSPEYTNYFMNLVMGTMKYRAENGIIRPDMINLLMEAKGLMKSEESGKEAKPIREWTDEEIVAQCFLFFFAGFENTALLMCLVAHELMENPETQEKLLQEIDDTKDALNGKEFSYETVNGMKYLDAVVNETLRKWPLVPMMDRVCSKSFKIEDPETNLSYEIKTGESVWIPAAGIHRDPKYYPNPSVFDPERFNDENKQKMNPFTYIPFGIGPRNCIASRFALLEAKAIICNLLCEFNFKASEKSTIPLKLSSNGFQSTPKNGFWLKLVQRTDLAAHA